jgi:hypothetical protein
MLLQLLHSFKAHALSFSVRFQDGRAFAHIAATLKSQTQLISVRSQEKQMQKYSNLLCWVYEVFMLLIDRLPLWPNSTKKSRGVRLGLRSGKCVWVLNAHFTDQLIGR